jgi:hypothetical protein
MKAPIIEIGHQSYLCKSLSKATDLAKLLGELVPVGLRHAESFRERWYEPSEDDDYCSLNVKLLVSEEVRKKPARLALPAPKRGAVKCLCGRASVRPGENCPSCDMHYHSILEARQS